MHNYWCCQLHAYFEKSNEKIKDVLKRIWHAFCSRQTVRKFNNSLLTHMKPGTKEAKDFNILFQQKNARFFSISLIFRWDKMAAPWCTKWVVWPWDHKAKCFLCNIPIHPHELGDKGVLGSTIRARKRNGILEDLKVAGCYILPRI